MEVKNKKNVSFVILSMALIVLFLTIDIVMDNDSDNIVVSFIILVLVVTSLTVGIVESKDPNGFHLPPMIRRICSRLSVIIIVLLMLSMYFTLILEGQT